MVPVIEALAPHVRVSVDTVKRGRGRGGHGGRGHPGQRHLGLVVAGGGGDRGGMGGHAHAGRAARPCRTIPATATWSAEVRSFLRRPGPGRHRGRRGRGVGRPRHRLRQDRRTEPGPARTTCPSWWPRRSGLAGAGGHQPQELSGTPGAGRRRRAPAPVGRRLPGSLATATWAMLAGASMVRVHDVAATVQAATLVGPAPCGT